MGDVFLQPEFKYVYIPVIVWFVLVIALFIALLVRFTFSDKPNPYKDETLAMPRGVLRAVLTVSVLFIVVLLEAMNFAMAGDFEEQISELLTAFQMVIAFYFGGKVMHHLAATDKNKTKATLAAMPSAPQQPAQPKPKPQPQTDAVG